MTPDRRAVWRLRPSDVILLLFVASLGVSLLISPFPNESVAALPPLVGGLIAYVVLDRAPWSRRALGWLGWALIGLGACLAGIGLLGIEDAPSGLRRDLLSLPGLSHVRQGLPGAFNANVIAGALVAMSPFPLTLMGRSAASPAGRALAWAAAAAMLSVLLMTGSRGGYLGAGCALAAYALLWWPRAMRWAAPLLLLGVLIGGTVVGWRAVLSALLTSDTIGDLSMRQEIWSRALTMMADFPFTGIGLGCFERLMGMLYPLFLAPKGTVTHAHNLFLQVGVDLGLPGLAAFALLLGLAFRSGLRAHRALAQERVDDLAALAAAGVASLAGICAHGMLDAAVWNNKGAFLPWVVMGLCVALGALHLPGCGAPPFVGQ